MVQVSPFCGLPSEDTNAHLQQFLELCDTIVIKDVAPEAIKDIAPESNAPLRSSPSSSLWAKPMPCEEESPISSKLR
jgi:hypothetical protein